MEGQQRVVILRCCWAGDGHCVATWRLSRAGQLGKADCSYKVSVHVQLHATGGASTCGPEGQLLLSSEDLRDIFVAATAELPGLLLSALIMDVFGRKW